MCIIIDEDNILVKFFTSEVFKYVYTSKINQYNNKVQQPILMYSLKYDTLKTLILSSKIYKTALILVKVLFESETLIYFLKLNNNYFVISYLFTNNIINSIYNINEY